MHEANVPFEKDHSFLYHLYNRGTVTYIEHILYSLDILLYLKSILIMYVMSFLNVQQSTQDLDKA